MRSLVSEDEDAEVDNARNHGARIDGPWVFGLRQGHDRRNCEPPAQ